MYLAYLHQIDTAGNREVEGSAIPSSSIEYRLQLRPGAEGRESAGLFVLMRYLGHGDRRR